MPGLKGKQYEVLRFIREKYGLKNVTLEDCDLYPICKRVITATGETIVYWDEADQDVKELTDTKDIELEKYLERASSAQGDDERLAQIMQTWSVDMKSLILRDGYQFGKNGIQTQSALLKYTVIFSG